jgi:hypothetical protein
MDHDEMAAQLVYPVDRQRVPDERAGLGWVQVRRP